MGGISRTMEENTYAFDGIEKVVNFYNAVLASPDTVEEDV